MVKAGCSNVKGQEHLDSKKWTAFSDWDQVFELGISNCRISSLSPSSCTHDFKWCLQRLGWDRSISEELRYSTIAKQAGQEERHIAGIELTHTNKIVDHCGRVRLDYSVQITTHHWHWIYCTIKFNSSRGVMRDPKSQFVNSSRGLELRDSPLKFVNPCICSGTCCECTVTQSIKLGITWAIYFN
jgi:hypothetical protein